MSEKHVKVITTNRKARFEYHVEAKVECGIALTGHRGEEPARTAARSSPTRTPSQEWRAVAVERAIPP